MSLFRRLRREKEDEGTAEEPTTAKPAPPPVEPAEATPAPAAAPSTPTPATPAPIPPPLPERPTPPAASAPPTAGPLTKCFVCGTPLEGHTCPTCRMTWKE